MEKAQKLFDEQKFDTCLVELKNAKSFAALELKARCHSKLEQYKNAQQIWEHLVDIDENNAAYWNELGVALFNLRNKGAMMAFDKAISLEKENPYFYSCRAFAKEKLGFFDQALKDYQKAKQLDPDDEIIDNNLEILGYKMNSNQEKKWSAEAQMAVENLKNELAMNETQAKQKTEQSLVGEFMKMFTQKGFKQFLKEVKYLWKKQ